MGMNISTLFQRRYECQVEAQTFVLDWLALFGYFVLPLANC